MHGQLNQLDPSYDTEAKEALPLGYATNEVTINWNVTLLALTAGLDALAD